jgi:hypothetical protein
MSCNMECRRFTTPPTTSGVQKELNSKEHDKAELSVASSQTLTASMPLSTRKALLLIVRFLSGLFGVLSLELVDCAFRVAYISNATSMPGLWCSYGCFSGLHFVMLLWFELCD